MRVPLEMQSVYGKAIQHPIHQNVTVFFALVTRIGVVPEINLGLNTIRNMRFLADSASSNERTYVMCEYPLGWLLSSSCQVSLHCSPAPLREVPI